MSWSLASSAALQSQGRGMRKEPGGPQGRLRGVTELQAWVSLGQALLPSA